MLFALPVGASVLGRSQRRNGSAETAQIRPLSSAVMSLREYHMISQMGRWDQWSGTRFDGEKYEDPEWQAFLMLGGNAWWSSEVLLS